MEMQAQAISGSTRLEYRIAFDMASALLSAGESRHQGRMLVASAPVFVEEALLRTAGPLTVVADSPWVAEASHRLAGNGRRQWPIPLEVMSYDSSELWSRRDHASAIWASPQPDTWRRWLPVIDAALLEGAPVALLVAGNGGWLLLPFRKQPVPGEPRWPAGSLRREMRRRGYKVTDVLSIGPPAAFGWAAAARLASIIGRPDLADRFEAGYRMALGRPTRRRLAALTLLIARREGPPQENHR